MLTSALICAIFAAVVSPLAPAEQSTQTPPAARAEAPPAAEEVAQPAAPAAEEPPKKPFYFPPFALKSPTMTGDWFGVRPTLHDLGIDFNFYYLVHLMSAMGGGLETNTGKWSATYDMFLALDLGKMGVLKDADVLVQARQQWGRSINRLPGVTPGMEVNDDADGDHGIYVDQLWFRQHLLGRKIALQVGYLDYQTIVDRNAYANSEDKQFMNAALDNNPLIPTASQTGLGAALYVKPCDWYSLIIGAGDAQRLPLYKPGFSTAFHDEAWFTGYMEHTISVKIPTAGGPLPGNYRVGMVYEPAPRAVFLPAGLPADQRGDDVGFYTSFDQMLFREKPDSDQGLGWFFRYGYRHKDIYRFNNFWSTGAVYTGLVPTRDKDVLGFGFAQQIDSDDYRNYVDPNSDNETIYELYYAVPLTPWLVLTPDIQYVNDPGGNETISHAWAGGLRLRVSF